MDTDKIKVLGAGLNAKEPNSEVSFHVTKPEKAVKVDSYAYKKQDAKAVHVRLVKIATSSNASKKLQFAVELAQIRDLYSQRIRQFIQSGAGQALSGRAGTVSSYTQSGT